MPVTKLKQFLDDHKVRYVSILHSKAYTSQETASLTHIPGQKFAKSVIIKIKGKMSMAVLPASYKVNFDLLKEVLGTDDVALASEQEFAAIFPGCEIGAMPPFGNIYGLDVYVAESLMGDEEIAFNAGTHTELMKIYMDDFKELVKPRVLKFSSKNAY